MSRLWTYAERKRLGQIRIDGDFHKVLSEPTKAELREQLRQAVINTAALSDKKAATHG